MAEFNNWDVMFEFPLKAKGINPLGAAKDVPQEKLAGQVNDVLTKLEGCEINLQVKTFKDEKNLYVLVGVMDEELHKWADRTQHLFLVDPARARTYAKTKNLPLADDKVPDTQWQKIWCPVDMDGLRENLYTYYPRWFTEEDYNEGNLGKSLLPDDPNCSIYRGSDRLKLIYDILQQNKFNGGCAIQNLKNCSPIESRFEEKAVQQRYHDMLRCAFFFGGDDHFFGNSMYNVYRHYHGEYTAFYFLFAFYFLKGLGWMMIYAGVMWFLMMENGFAGFIAEKEIACFIVVLMSVLPIHFSEMWSRKECEVLVEWGTDIFAHNGQIIREKFSGKDALNAVTGLSDIHYNWSRWPRLFFSTLITFALLIVSITINVGVMAMKKTGDIPLSGQSDVVLNIILTTIASFITTFYKKVVVPFSTKVENHRTMGEFENTIIVKNFFMEFCLIFNPLYWIAFMEPYFYPDSVVILEGKTFDESILLQLSNTAFQLCIMKQIAKNGIAKWVTMKTLKSIKNLFSKPAEQHPLVAQARCPEFNRQLLINNIIILYGFVVCFLIVTPSLAFLAVFFLIIFILFTGYELLYEQRRPRPNSITRGIGSYKFCFKLIGFIGIFSNMGIICSRTPLVDIYLGEGHRLSAWFVMSLALLCLALSSQVLLDDVSGETMDLLNRQKLITNCLMHDENIVHHEAPECHHVFDLEGSADLSTLTLGSSLTANTNINQDEEVVNEDEEEIVNEDEEEVINEDEEVVNEDEDINEFVNEDEDINEFVNEDDDEFVDEDEDENFDGDDLEIENFEDQ